MRINVPKLLFVVVLLTVCYLVIPPLFFTVKSSLSVTKMVGPADFSLKYYADILTSADTPVMILNSFKFAIGSSLIALFIGTLLAWLVERTNTPFKSLAYLSAFTSFAIPGIIKVIGWILLLGPEAGLINTWMKSLFGLKSHPFNIFTMTGMIFVEGMLWTPLVFLFMAAPFRSMDPAFEDSAYMSGSGISSTFYHVTLQLALPSVLSVLLLSFIRTMEAFEIPALIGIPGGITVLTSEIYLKIRSGFMPKYGIASAYAIILMIFVLIGLYFYSRTARQAQRFHTITGKGFRPRLLDVGRWRYLTTALVCILPAFLVLPVFILFWASFLPFYTQPSFDVLSKLTLANYKTVFQNTIVLGALKNSLFIGLSSATATILLTAVMAWIVLRTNIAGKWLLEHLASFTMVFPGVVLGVALLLTYLTIPIPLYGTIWILVVAYITRYIPYGIRFCSPGLLQINKELEESAQVSGAPWGTVFRKIVIPLMMPSLFAGWIWVFLHSVMELSVAILLSHPGSEVISVLIFDMWENGAVTNIGAFSICLTVVLVALSSFFRTLSNRYGLQIQGQQ